MCRSCTGKRSHLTHMNPDVTVSSDRVCVSLWRSSEDEDVSLAGSDFEFQLKTSERKRISTTVSTRTHTRVLLWYMCVFEVSLFLWSLLRGFIIHQSATWTPANHRHRRTVAAALGRTAAPLRLTCTRRSGPAAVHCWWATLRVTSVHCIVQPSDWLFLLDGDRRLGGWIQKRPRGGASGAHKLCGSVQRL